MLISFRDTVSLRVTSVDVLERTFGQDGAVVGAFKRPKSSDVVELDAAAARVILQRVMENPGPFNELSKMPEYILTGLICQFTAVRY